MKTVLKRALVWSYCQGWLSVETAQRIYDRFNLKGF